MPYDPAGAGATAGDELVRRGVDWESARRLARQAAAAAHGGTATNGVAFGHGVSVSSPEANQRLARDPSDAVRATRAQIEAEGFEVRYTPTRQDTDHHTIILPEPVTDEVAAQFNTLFGRTP
jgi:hypothetical protein